MPTWRERIVAARERGTFTDEDMFFSSSWLSCAVHEQHVALPSVVLVVASPDMLEPTDPVLFHLGGETGFCAAVMGNKIDEAERLLDAIEDRVLQLKRAL